MISTIIQSQVGASEEMSHNVNMVATSVEYPFRRLPAFSAADKPPEKAVIDLYHYCLQRGGLRK